MKSIKARNSRNSNKKIQGLALLEILIAIGILGIISAGVATLASRTFEEQNVNAISKGVVDAGLSIKKGYQRASAYPVAKSMSVFVDSSLVSKESSTNPVTNNLYGYIGGLSKNAGSGVNDAFAIVVEGLEPSVCVKLLGGVLPENAAYIEVVDSGNGMTGATFDVVPGGAVFKTMQGYATGSPVDAEDPTTYTNACTHASNAIIYGYY
ncbi:prepilin-type N-terminal cleavage/methylation domain-containing protein [Vibrio aestuarianus]|uniref:Prepilin-type N-terminal cleavage/methylation domain-containing protein n=1 Tax=Vibrio aestuarianus TaxID=28171 RepID=A0A9X4FG71_9VIBR|nr:prepilin-type N-terminal cleavage/methylation domain-containing protein [Vibrio aestuarianus]MDE1310420.1 prepilin-type N-terminal cleavage/methylation domain-containing protein [Vibrio aestuarianus]MDE1356514.1 prepilin-type N-terminal cleavage/methylation domain-containing protein [Vibrio aestuarianus]NGZ17663.1 hypothetical protein [Vibrio aestuarianus]NGZ92712.1 hypothetical protein [Vibrio aestuarianus subsp. cardii]